MNRHGSNFALELSLHRFREADVLVRLGTRLKSLIQTIVSHYPAKPPISETCSSQDVCTATLDASSCEAIVQGTFFVPPTRTWFPVELRTILCTTQCAFSVNTKLIPTTHSTTGHVSFFTAEALSRICAVIDIKENSTRRYDTIFAATCTSADPVDVTTLGISLIEAQLTLAATAQSTNAALHGCIRTTGTFVRSPIYADLVSVIATGDSSTSLKASSTAPSGTVQAYLVTPAARRGTWEEVGPPTCQRTTCTRVRTSIHSGC